MGAILCSSRRAGGRQHTAAIPATAFIAAAAIAATAIAAAAIAATATATTAIAAAPANDAAIARCPARAAAAGAVDDTADTVQSAGQLQGANLQDVCQRQVHLWNRVPLCSWRA